ncbi:uncharacterized protein LOC133984398 [Scomber scombrus]|uniref:uncharacterized protein LOC133984398 n=1 Tax=Scomber scombrus TaxID=13677 RepID=UPI002DD98C70|nr:uncharacterized protein LOC133984398 [Scomber scombrus]
MMKLILSLTLIWTLSSTAEAVDCWVGKGDSSFLFPCNSSELCATVAKQGKKSTEKMCSSFFMEGKHTFSLNLGFEAMAASVQACDTVGCNNKTIPYPGVQQKNGMKCYVCNNRYSPMCNKTVECMGMQDRCINGTAEDEEKKNATIYTRGCVSANLCEDVRRLEFFMDVKFLRKPKCCGKNLCNSAWSVRLNVMSLLLGLFTLTFY